MRDDMKNITIPENLGEKVDESLAIIRKRERRKMVRRTVITGGSVAAVFAAFLIFCMANPVMASKLPLIGRIFQEVEQDVSYKGDFSARAENLQPEVQDGDVQDVDNAYVQTVGDTTVTISEIYYNSKALYLSMSVENTEGFPEDFVMTENMEDYIWDYDTLNFQGSVNYSFMSEESYLFEYVEGHFKDANTFIGILRLDVAHLTWWPNEEELGAAGIVYPNTEGVSEDEAMKLGDEYNQKVKEAFPEAGEVIAVPEEFSLDLNIGKISGDLFDMIEEEATFPDGEAVTVSNPVKKEYEGPWNFHFDIQVDYSQTQTVEVNDVYEEGVGIAKVEKTPYEITAELVIPESEREYDYFVAICDANGDLLDHQGNFTDTYQVYGRDTSKVTVFVCDYIQYMDELKGYYWSEDYEAKKAEKTYAEYLKEHAKYWVDVEYEE